MEVRRLKDLAEIGPERWAALCERSGTDTIFQTYEWHQAWWNAYGDASALYLLAVEEGSDLVGIAPMMLSQGAGGRKVLAFIGDYRSDYLDFIYGQATPETVDVLVAYLADRRSDWDIVNLSEIPEGSPTHDGLVPACERGGLYCATVRKRQCPALIIRNNETQVKRITNKKRLRYYKRHFEEKSGFRVRHLAGYEEITEHLDGFFEQHIARWAGTSTPSIFLEEKSKVFYRNLLSSMCDRGWITFTVIESEGTAIAYHFGFTYRNVFVLYKPVFNPLLAKRSPGQVLLKELMELALTREYDEFDFTVGAEAYKQRFASVTRYNTTYRILKSKAEVRALRSRTALKRRLEAIGLGRSLLALKKDLTSRRLPRLRETVRAHGVAGWIRRAARMAFRRFIFRYSRMVFFEMPEGAIAEHQIEPKLEDVIFREGTISDLARFDYPRSPVAKRELLAAWRKNLEEGARCFVAEIGGEVAATIWIRVKDYTYISEAETYVPLPDNPVCFYDAWTLPKYRGKRLLTFLYSRVLELYPEKRKVAYLYESNVGSFRAALALGNFRLTRTYHFLNILGVKLRWHKPYTGPQPTV